jgi:hypothetical protein
MVHLPPIVAIKMAMFLSQYVGSFSRLGFSDIFGNLIIYTSSSSIRMLRAIFPLRHFAFSAWENDGISKRME